MKFFQSSYEQRQYDCGEGSYEAVNLRELTAQVHHFERMLCYKHRVKAIFAPDLSHFSHVAERNRSTSMRHMHQESCG